MQDQHQGTTMTGKIITRADLTEAVYDTVSRRAFGTSKRPG
jgi:hypothetical protein